MKVLMCSSLVLGYAAILPLLAAASGELSDLDRHAKRGIQHGQRGFVHFQEMIAQLQYIQKKRAEQAGAKEDKGDEELALALRHAKEAFVHYAEALRIAGQSFGFFDKSALEKHGGVPHEETENVARKEVFKPVPMPVRPQRSRAGGPLLKDGS
ncbi:MAG: hypothetical protein ACE5G9_01005 [Nitrospinales bacterium]